MFCTVKSPEQRRLVRSCWISAVLVVPLGNRRRRRVSSLASARVCRPMPWLCCRRFRFLWVLVEMGRFLAVEKDEFQRNLLMQCLLGGIGGTLATTTIWGYLEDFAHAPHLDLVCVYPIFWLFVVVSYPLVRLRYR